MMKNLFDRRATDDPLAPGIGSKTVTPSDTDDIFPGEVARALHVFGDGAVCFIGTDGVEDTWTFTAGMAFPQVIPVAVTKVKETGTSVTEDIKAIR